MKFENENGRPLPELTNNEWQGVFATMKDNAISSTAPKYNTRTESMPKYLNAHMPETQWTRYKQFINNTLKTIRNGEEDYCFYTYQIADLLRFEKDRLMSEYSPVDRCFKVWLAN